MYIEDLSTNAVLARGPKARAIGWLETGRVFPTKQPSTELVEALRRHLGGPRWLPVASFGPHFCDLGCTGRAGGAQSLIIPSRDVVYVAPELVLHYVEEHHYSPPQEFITALLACPEQSSEAYVALLEPHIACFSAKGVFEMTPQAARKIAERARRSHAEQLAREEEEKKKVRFSW